MKLVIACTHQWFKLDKKIALENELLLIEDQSSLTQEILENFNPDFVFFPHWNWVVPPEIHENFECVVFHTAPLPYGRGGSPIQNLILENFREAPVCALKMTSELDAGPIYAKKTISLEGNLSEILDRINMASNELIMGFTKDSTKPAPQEGKVHNFKRRTAKENLIPAGAEISEIYDRIRMLDDRAYPQAFMNVGDLRIEFNSASIENDSVIAQCKITKC